MRYLVRQMSGTRAVGQLLRVSQRTVERYVKDQIKQSCPGSPPAWSVYRVPPHRGRTPDGRINGSTISHGPSGTIQPHVPPYAEPEDASTQRTRPYSTKHH